MIFIIDTYTIVDNYLKIGNNMLEYKGPKIWTDAEILYEMKFWYEIEKRDYLKFNTHNKI